VSSLVNHCPIAQDVEEAHPGNLAPRRDYKDRGRGRGWRFSPQRPDERSGDDELDSLGYQRQPGRDENPLPIQASAINPIPILYEWGATRQGGDQGEWSAKQLPHASLYSFDQERRLR